MLLRIILVSFVLISVGCTVVAKKPVDTVFFAIKGIQFAFTLAIPDSIPVEATGSGSTREIAIQNAIIASIQEVLGVLIVSEVSIQDNKLLNDIAIAYSNGVVTKYSIKECIYDQRTVCTIRATVSTKNIQFNFSKNESAVNIDGSQLYSQHISNRNSIIQRNKLLLYYFSKIEKSGLDLSITSIKTIPTSKTNIPIKVTYSVKWNEDFKDSFIKFLLKMQKDTGAENYPVPPGVRGGNADAYDQYRDLKISLGKSIFGRNDIYIKLKDPGLVKELNKYIYPSLQIYIEPFGTCTTLMLPGSVFRLNEIGEITRSITIESSPQRVKNLEKILMKFGCK